MAMKAKDLRGMDLAELQLRAAELQKAMFDVRQRLTTKEQLDTSDLAKKKRDYARLLTIINEKTKLSAA